MCVLKVCSPALPDEIWCHATPDLWSMVRKRGLTCLSSAGFVDLQTEKADLMENVGAIPFLDYKHFASRIFFPEVQLGQNVHT